MLRGAFVRETLRSIARTQKDEAEFYASLGLANTVYLGEGRYERDSARFCQYLVPVGADDCLALLK